MSLFAPSLSNTMIYGKQHSCEAFTTRMENSSRLLITLFTKSYCPHCVELKNWEWQYLAMEIESAPRVDIVEVDMLRCSGVARSLEVQAAPTIVLIHKASYSHYTGQRTAQGILGAAQRAITKFKVPVAIFDPLVPIWMLSSATADLILHARHGARPFLVQVSAKWPPSRSLLDVKERLRGSTEIELAFVHFADTRLISLLGTSKKGFYLFYASRPASLPNLHEHGSSGVKVAGNIGAGGAVILSNEKSEKQECVPWLVDVHSLNFRDAPSTSSGAILGQWAAGMRFSGTCVDLDECAWLKMCADDMESAAAVDHLGSAFETGQMSFYATRTGTDGSLRIVAGIQREKEQIRMLPGASSFTDQLDGHIRRILLTPEVTAP